VGLEAAGPGGIVAKGKIAFPEAPLPPQRRWHQRKTYDRYLQLMLAPELRQVAAKTLGAYLDFANLHQRNEHAAPICLALLARRDLRDDARRHDALLTLARTSPDPEVSRKAYRALLGGKRRPETPAIALEYLEFELYRQRDLEAVKAVTPQVAALVGEREPVLLLYRTEAALYSGDTDRATAGVAALRGRIGGEFRRAAARGNAARETAEKQMNERFFAEAEKHLREWAVLEPGALTTGQYALVRARLLQRYGWHEGALMVLEAVQKLNPLPPFLPELELHLGIVHQVVKHPAKARAIFEHITKDYPKHPVAQEAARRLKALP
jgi:hypothetical protein